jgi:hypothetical protein
MFCTYCKMARVENSAPCPNCGAPSPLFSQSQYTGKDAENPDETGFGGPGTAGTGFGEQWEQPVQQLSFEDSSLPAAGTAMQSWPWQGPQSFVPTGQQPVETYNPMPSWQQTAFEQGSVQRNTQGLRDSGAQPEQQSLLPVPYEPGRTLQSPQRQSTISLQLVPDHAIQHLLMPEQNVGETVYVAPMYTKPRPIVPRYRIISGLLSIIIMALAVCGGAGYYAQTQGVLAKTTRFITGAPPANLPMVSSSNIPNPPEATDKDRGPAYNVIQSAVTTLNIDKNNLAKQPATIFKPGQIFYLVFNVSAPADGKGGKVSTKWYTNNALFKQIDSSGTIKAGENMSGNIPMRFTAPLSGRIELYWNDQLAQKLYFAVK